MKKVSLQLAGLILLIGVYAHAGNGDLIVDGNLGIGTNTPGAKLDVRGTIYSQFASSSVNVTSGVGTGHEYQNADATPGNYAASLFYDANGWLQGSIGMKYGNHSGNNQGDFYIEPRIVANPSSFIVKANGNVGIGTADPQSYKLYVAGPAYSTGGWQGSDIRFKKNLLPIKHSLDKVRKLEGYSYVWKTEEYKDKGFPEGRHYGVIAQEVEKVLPEIVSTAPDGTKAVAYTEIIPVLIEAIKEQQKRIELLEKKLAQIGK